MTPSAMPERLDFVAALRIAQAKFARHPYWKQLDGTPWSNDAPVIAAELMCQAQEASADLVRELVEALGAALDLASVPERNQDEGWQQRWDELNGIALVALARWRPPEASDA